MITLSADPKLLDFVRVCDQLPVDERKQMEAAFGRPYDFEWAAGLAYQQPAPRWVFLDEGRPVALAGYVELRPGVWRDWMLTTEAARRQPIALTRLCRLIMKSMIDAGAHRLECVSLADRTAAHKWYRSLGLKFEGKLTAWGANGEDAMMFARVENKNGHV